MLYEEGFTQNREISWLRYNERVLEEALNTSVPLLERLRFVSIFMSNLDEFFMVRVGSLIYEDKDGDDEIDEKSGMDPGAQLRAIQSMIPGLLLKKDMTLAKVEKELFDAGIKRYEPEYWNESVRSRCFDFFRDSIKSRLRVKILDSENKMPAMEDGRSYMIAMLDAELEDRIGVIDIPKDIPQVFVLSRGEKGRRSFIYVLTEDIIKMFADTLFVPFVPLEIHSISIARNAEAGPEERTANTAEEMRRILKKRKKAGIDKLTIDGKPGRKLNEYIKNSLNLRSENIYVTARVDMSYIDALIEAIPEEISKSHLYKPFKPYNQMLEIKGSVIEELENRDILSAYPYDSMDVLLELLREAAFSDKVREIRITIYRLADNPKICEYLIYAARNGKTVKAVLELRARFDEEKNIAWAERLSNAGCMVYYGMDKYKVHSKICQIVLSDEMGQKEYITQLSTGNFNEVTAKRYTDFALLTHDQRIGKAASLLFKDIIKDRFGDDESEEALKDRYSPLLVSPVNMREKLVKLIRREAAKKEKGFIFLKLNSLSDKKMMEELMEASCSGCRIYLIVRGICCLLPGIEGCTENICIVNLLGRFLEHSRVYIFGEGPDEKIYISSADFMSRNLNRRVELACKITDENNKSRIRDMIKMNYLDTEGGRVMMPDGSYALKESEERIDSQCMFLLRFSSSASVGKYMV